MTAFPKTLPLYSARAGKIIRHAPGSDTIVDDGFARDMLAAHRRIAATPTEPRSTLSARIADEIQSALAEAALQRADQPTTETAGA